MKNNVKVATIIVGLGQYHNASNRLFRQVSNLNLSGDVIIIDNNKLIHILQIESINLKYFSEKLRGYGYWMWKPVIIYHFLKKEYDQIIYLDAGSEIIDEPFRRIYKWFYNSASSMIVSPSGQKMESYCKDDSASFFFKDEEWKNIKQLQMFQAGVVFLKNTEEISNLFSRIYILVKNEKIDLFDDVIVREFNNKQFVEHRHDQSIFNLLMYKTCNLNNIVVLPSTLTPVNHNIGFNSFAPVICIRNINFLSYGQLYSVYDNNNSFPLFLRIISRILILLFKNMKSLHSILDYIYIKLCFLWTLCFNLNEYSIYLKKLNVKEDYDEWLTVSQCNKIDLNE